MWETWFSPWVGKIPWRRQRLPTSVFWPGEFHGLHSPWSHKESDTTEGLSLTFSDPGTSGVAQRVESLPTIRAIWAQSLSQEDPLEKEMATHSSILPWKIPWMEKPGGLQSMGSQRVGHG